eukprot:6218207-Pyramimonas_sp.AAC.1
MPRAAVAAAAAPRAASAITDARNKNTTGNAQHERNNDSVAQSGKRPGNRQQRRDVKVCGAG